MKKTLVLAVFLTILMPLFSFAADSTADSKLGTIKEEIQKKMDAIKKGGKGGEENVKEEIKIDRYAPKKPTATPTPSVDDREEQATLALMNVTAGVFQGAIAGTCIGMIEYSKHMNTRPMALINGAIIGSLSGAGLAYGLSIVQLITKKAYISDDFGYGLLGGIGIGSMLGAAGGFISYAKTDDLENVSEGIGWGVAIGAIFGIGVATFEFFLPEEMRVVGGNRHAMRIDIQGDGVMAAVSIPY